jgi:hypothetical protein
MDATLLVTNSYVDFRSGSLASLTFRDLTIHTDDRDLARIRDALFTIRMERCRVIGFDTAAACASMLAGQVGAFWAKDCRFEAGFGRSPGDGVLFDVRGMLLARFDNCDVVGTIGLGVGTMCSTQVFANCRFTRQAPYVREGFERPRGGTAEFTGSTFQYLASNQDKAARAKRSVTEFNPAWKDPKR